MKKTWSQQTVFRLSQTTVSFTHSRQLELRKNQNESSKFDAYPNQRWKGLGITNRKSSNTRKVWVNTLNEFFERSVNFWTREKQTTKNGRNLKKKSYLVKSQSNFYYRYYDAMNERKQRDVRVRGILTGKHVSIGSGQYVWRFNIPSGCRSTETVRNY